MTERFLNRDEELGMLRRRWDSGEGQIFLLWGRRRVGKTELLLEFGRDKRALYFEATSGTRADHLGDFSGRLAEATGGAGLTAPDWRTALGAVADWAEAEGPVLLVLDEFQHIARESPDIGSEINVWWRERGRELPIFVVLSGSEVGFFEREVVAYSASAYGRRAGQLRLEPFRPRDVGLFLPEWSAEDRIRAYAVFGNMPYYLAHVRPEASLEQNILDLILMRDGLLHEEARLLLDAELPDASAYFSVLRAIAAGQTRVNQIDQRTGIGGSSRVSQMLDRLQRLWLVRKELPVTVRDPARSRQSFYRIVDPYLRFWFRFVLPAQGRLADAEGARRQLEGSVMPRLDEFVSAPAFEEVCQEWLRRETDAAAVGWWWGRVREMRDTALRDVDRELDAVALDDAGDPIAIASCKWTAGPMPTAELRRLETLATHLRPEGERPALFFFSRSGFADRLQQAAADDPRLRLVTPEQM
ncbi:MAG TPA: ATP-binding protein [Thermoanaerobaculia bacterium]|nr:ATP-binding protein [Thermoanaerobaculia bacterium]